MIAGYSAAPPHERRPSAIQHHEPEAIEYQSRYYPEIQYGTMNPNQTLAPYNQKPRKN